MQEQACLLPEQERKELREVVQAARLLAEQDLKEAHSTSAEQERKEG